MAEDDSMKFFKMLDEQNQGLTLDKLKLQNDLSKISNFPVDKDPDLIKYQLDPDKILDRMYHILSGHILQEVPGGGDKWIEPEDDRLKILSEDGVRMVMQILYNYINPHMLLGNIIDVKTANWKTRDFAIEFIDLLFCRYEMFFYYPKPEELYEEYVEIILEDPQSFPHLVSFEKGKARINREELYEKCLEWSKEELRHKATHFNMLVQMITDLVNNVYLRSLGGKERDSLRKNTIISQNSDANFPEMQPQKRGINRLWE